MLTFLTYLGSKSTNLETEIDNVFELEKQLGMVFYKLYFDYKIIKPTFLD